MSIDFNSAQFVASYAKAGQIPASELPEVSFVGRSNVGKSSIMNKIFKRKGLVKVSSKPGSTQAVNFFIADGVNFVDLPGYGYAKVSPEAKKVWQGLVDSYFELDRRFALCVLLVDIRHDASRLDIQMAQYLMAHEIPFIIAFTKSDKLTKSKTKQQMKALCTKFAFAGDTYVLSCSAVSGDGVDDLRQVIEDAVSQEIASQKGQG